MLCAALGCGRVGFEPSMPLADASSDGLTVHPEVRTDEPFAGSLAATGSGYSVVWHDQIVGQLYAAHVGPNGLPSGGQVQLLTAGAIAHDPDMRSVGSAFVVVWQDQRDGDREL